MKIVYLSLLISAAQAFAPTNQPHVGTSLNSELAILCPGISVVRGEKVFAEKKESSFTHTLRGLGNFNSGIRSRRYDERTISENVAKGQGSQQRQEPWRVRPTVVPVAIFAGFSEGPGRRKGRAFDARA